MTLRRPSNMRLPEQAAERTRREHRDAITALQALAILGAKVIPDVSLADATETPIKHGMGRRVRVFISPVRGASTSGRVEEVRSATHDPAKVVVLKATGFGATVLTDVLVMVT